MEGHELDDHETSSRILTVKLCRYFKWTLQEYRDQPHWFIQDCIKVISTENKYKNFLIEKESKKHG
jgi:hypothetical protein